MSKVKENKKVCGIVMPISSIDGCSEKHWVDILSILSEAIEASGFGANLVSNADDVGIIQKRIIQNLYENPIVICDVSCKNPNVMFELGMRLAFDRPTIIIKDDKTSYSFDTSPIEHLEYPRDLRFGKIVDFKEKLKDKILNTYTASQDNPSYTTFLKHFGEFTVAKIDTKEVSGSEYIIEELKNLRMSIARLEHRRFPVRRDYEPIDSEAKIEIEVDDEEQDLKAIAKRLMEVNGTRTIRIKAEKGKRKLLITANDDIDMKELYEIISPLVSDRSSKKKHPIG